MAMSTGPKNFTRHTEPGDEPTFVRHADITAPSASTGAKASVGDEEPKAPAKKAAKKAE